MTNHAKAVTASLDAIWTFEDTLPQRERDAAKEAASLLCIGDTALTIAAEMLQKKRICRKKVCREVCRESGGSQCVACIKNNLLAQARRQVE